MQQLIYFIQKYKYFLYFLLLQFIALALIVNNHSFHKSKFVSSANAITGGIYNKTANFSDYLNLKNQNELLSEENAHLKNKLAQFLFLSDSIIATTYNDSLYNNQEFTYINAKVRKNEFHTPHNYITINRGKKHGISSEMAVINSKGVIGITDAVTNKYARVQSILNRNSQINARFKNNNYFGPLKWDGKDYKIVQLTDIPREANFNIGDTIVTSGRSTIFPGNILIGTVLNKPKSTSSTNSIDIKLFNDMSNLGYVYVIKSLDKKEINYLENQSNE